MAHILWFFEFASINGGENSAMAVMPHLVEAGMQITAAAPADGSLANRLRQQGIPVIDFSLHDQAGTRLSEDCIHKQITDILHAQQPDILHANSLAMGKMTGPVAAKAGISGLCHIRDIYRLSQAAANKVNGHDRLLYVSQATQQWHEAGGLHRARGHTLFNGIDTEQFRPRPPSGALHLELGIDPASILLGTIGQIGMRKGQDILLQAMAKLVDRHPLLHLLIIGMRQSNKEEAIQFEQALHRAAEEPLLRGKIHFLGRREDVPKLLPELTMLVHAARQEPLGRVLLEGAASGLPIVATDVGGTSEIFPEDEKAALLVPSKDPDLLATGLDRLLAEPLHAAQMGQAARARIESAFSVERAANNLLVHYKQIVDS